MVEWLADCLALKMEQTSAELWVEWLDNQLALTMVGKKAVWMVELMVRSTVAEKVEMLALHLVAWKV